MSRYAPADVNFPEEEMSNIPKWAKVLGAMFLAAALLGAARLLLWFDQMGGARVGLD